MKLQFDPNQQFQVDAIAAVTDLFEGQPHGAPEFSVIRLGDFGELFAGQERTELGVGNRIVDEERLHANLRRIQQRNDIEVDDPSAPLESWTLFDAPANRERRCPHFSVEMETGTGKTYVYLRTILELSQRYGIQKFVIVVPSIAIREGVLKNLEITAEHFKALTNNLPVEHFVYDSKRVNRLRHFATSNTLQIMVINVQAFRREQAIINRESDRMGGRPPIEFVQAARPVVIIDEPQSVDSTEGAQEAIRSLNPLCTLRYSATHRDPYNLVYSLDPVRAFELRLVKQIIVASATEDSAGHEAFVRLDEVDNKKAIRARLAIHAQTASGPKEKRIWVKHRADLHTLSGEFPAYADGYQVAEINTEPGNSYVVFSNGTKLELNGTIGGMRDEVWRTQIRHTLRRHLDKELQVRERGIKVLSLFFIDRVANYRDYVDGQPVPGKFATAFEEELAALAAEPRYASIDWLKQPVERLHNGYFAQDRKGVLQDTRGESAADEAVYDLIMKDKERLLSLDEPLRFIFSHSALREGWDNPNVFQICTLNETRSSVKKRQEIGRGLRLPVDKNGVRVFDDSINRLYVMANESYEDFARALQTEYEQDAGVTFGKVPLTALARLTRVVERDGELAEEPIGRPAAEAVRAALVQQGILDDSGRILAKFEPQRSDFALVLPEEHEALAPALTDLLSSYLITRHVRRDRDEKPNPLHKEVLLTPEFLGLWERIKPRTTYRVEYATDELIHDCVREIKKMPTIEKPQIRVVAGEVAPTRGGVDATALSVAEETVKYGTGSVPDLLAYFQAETELTRSTLVRILTESGRLGEFFNHPQRFMDSVASIIKATLHRLLVDGIKYERIKDGPDAAWEQLRFRDGEAVNLLTALQVSKSVCEYVPYDSEIEREFARRLDQREDIKLFLKLPSWFKIDTPIGTYNPDWAIVKYYEQTLYLLRETKGTRDFMKLRNSERDKVFCGARHFDALGVSFDVVTGADEI